MCDTSFDIFDRTQPSPNGKLIIINVFKIKTYFFLIIKIVPIESGNISQYRNDEIK